MHRMVYAVELQEMSSASVSLLRSEAMRGSPMGSAQLCAADAS